MKDREIAGILLFIGVFEFSLFLLIGEALRPTYSVHSDYISQLGVGSYNYLFNYPIIILGILVVIAAYMMWKFKPKTVFPILVVIMGASAAGVGIFPMNTGSIHGYFADITFISAGLAAIVGAFWFKGSLRVISPAIGIIILISIILYTTGYLLGLGKGGMERMIVYPTLLWGMLVAGYLINSSSESR
ncbi:MAG: DUF998 domain-containing protein [Candidatus Thermoplasmatota archaeon]|nr:DUF998 domain-containing protein [Candidatus Thermoplasmatota archaeon]MCL5730613.1 DUF998 domain-containing protein [Candidatus Thermoplasmatota archaeon]